MIGRPPNGVKYTYPSHFTEAALVPLRKKPGNWLCVGGNRLIRTWSHHGRWYGAVYPMPRNSPVLPPGLTVPDDFDIESEAIRAAREMIEARPMTLGGQ